MNIFISRIYELMKIKDLTQSKLAKGIFTTQQAISRYLKNERTPDIITLKNLAIFFNVSTDYLLGLTDEETPTWVHYTKREEPQYNPPPQQDEYLTALARADKRTKFKVSKKKLEEMKKHVKPENE